MKVERSDEIIARIERAVRDSPGGFVATDGDGTLWSGDVGEDLFHAFLDRGRVEAPAHAAMQREAKRFGLDASGDAVALGRRIYAEYLAGRFPEEPVCELMTWCFAGWSRDEVDAFARDVVRGAKLETRRHQELSRVLAWVRSAGVELFLVSASPTAVIEAAAALFEIDPTHVVASTPCFEAAGMLPDVVRPIPYGAGKVAGLRAKTAGRPFYAAFGDNAFDLAMLKEATVAVAVRPKHKLRERAGELPALVELAREP